MLRMLHGVRVVAIPPKSDERFNLSNVILHSCRIVALSKICSMPFFCGTQSSSKFFYECQGLCPGTSLEK